MAALVLHVSRAFTPHREILNATVVIEDGRIAAIGAHEEVSPPAHARVMNFPGMTLVPGFVDVHIHGAGGHDVMEGDASALAAVTRTVARFGTTSLVAATVTASLDSTCRATEAMARYIHAQTGSTPGTATSEILGIHFEGPFLSSVRRGVQPAQWIVPPSRDAFRKMLEAASGCARILTLAPELDGASELQAAARQRDLRVAIGHSNASYQQAVRAIDAGAAHAVHVYNAMRTFAHRDPGILGAVLTDDRIYAEVIADGVHVAAPALRLLLRSKTALRIALVTDAVSATGMAPGKYRLGEMDILLSDDPSTGQPCCRSCEGKLAGSVLTQDRAVQNMMQLAGASLREAVLMASYVPAQMAGVGNRKGSLRSGFDADLAVLNADGTVVRAIVGGVFSF